METHSLRTVGIVSLGCSKNRVDSERMMGFLTREGFVLTNNPREADVLIVNTCGFIESAKQESINTILEMAAYKEIGRCRKLVVTGCLSERYRRELPPELPEVDLWLGVREYETLAGLLRGTGARSKDYCYGERVLSTPSHYAYLRVADGCNNRCTYCAIPAIRGPYVSRPFDEVVAEAEELVARGAKELVVIAQDTTRYGTDLPEGRRLLAPLLRRLAETDAQWIRVLYAYPDEIDKELLDAMDSSEKIVRYVDIPLQHADDTVLRRMNRRGTHEELCALMEEFRRRDPRYILRTTFMVGFPGETEEQFETLCRFVREHPFDRMGVFTYSPEEGTPAAEFDGAVPEEEKQRRADVLMRIQQEVSKDLNEARVGKTYAILVEGFDHRSRKYFGRSYGEAAEIDGKVIFSAQKEHEIGEFVPVRITKALEYDLIGEEESNESAQ